MSVLETPRVYFRGQIAWDPIVTNNYAKFYNENTADNVPAHQDAQAFRARAIQDVTGGGTWNPQGTHKSTFFQTEVSGVDIGAGLDLTDPLVGAPVSFLGMLVDCEPYGTFTSQLFFDTMQFGIRGGCGIGCKREKRMTSRYINFNRNSVNMMKAGIASTIWQTSFPKEMLALDAHDSAAIGQLLMAMESPDVLGLTVRWNSYRTIYFDDACLRNGSPAARAAAAALAAKLGPEGDDCWQPNPARSLIVGVLGLWREGEPAQEPGDRAMLTIPPGEVVGSAFARLCGDNLVVDLGNSIAEIDTNLTKQNFGTLHVVAANAGTTTTLASINYGQYARAAYEQTAGIVTLPLSGEAAAAATAEGAILQLQDGDANNLLCEDPVRALPGVQNLYLNEGDGSDVQVQVSNRGEVAGTGETVDVYDATGSTPVLFAQATTDASGVATVHFQPASTGGCSVYIFVPGGAPAPAGLDTQITPYMYIRVLPADAAIGALEPTWTNLYNNVLVNWHAMAPCMDNWLDLGDENQVRRYAGMLKALTDPAAFESLRFMPVVRDMTDGERTLLYAFLDSPAAKSAPATTLRSEAPGGQPEAADKHIANLQKLSRAMRS